MTAQAAQLSSEEVGGAGRGGDVMSSGLGCAQSSTRAFIKKYAEKELGAVSAKVVAEMRYDLPASYRFHKKDSKDKKEAPAR